MENISDDPLEQFIAAGLASKPTPPSEDNDDPDLDDTPDPAPAPTQTSDDDADVRQAYYEYLVETGLVTPPEDFEFDGSETALAEIIESSKSAQQQEAINRLWSHLSPEFQSALEFALNGGTSLEEFQKAYSVPDFSNLDLKSVENQRKIIKQYYLETTRQTPEKIDRLIARLEDDGDLESEALQTLEELEEIRQDKRAKYLAKQQEQEEELRKENARKTQELVQAITTSPAIHPARREKVRAFFFNPIKVDGQMSTSFNETLKAIRSNPEHQAQLADILLDYSTKDGLTLDRLEKRVKSRATSTFQEKLRKAVKTQASAQPQKTNQSDSNDFLNKWLSA